MKIRNLAALVLFTIFTSAACTKAYRPEFIDLRKARGNTEEQQLAAYYDSFRFIVLEWDESKKQYNLTFKKLTLDQLEDQFNNRLKDYEWFLDYNNEDAVKFLDFFGLRAEFEREEELVILNRNRIRVMRIYSDFQRLMGIRSSSGSSDEYGSPDSHNRVDMKALYTLKDPKTELLFESPTISEARANGTLEKIEDFTWVSDQTYAVKEPDPTDPLDPNKFIWRSMKRAVRFRGYKILNTGTDKPRDNAIDYIEGFRVKDDKGNLESKPALKLFIHNSHAVLVIDQDQEKELGFGLPEVVTRLNRVLSASSFMNEGVVATLYPDKPEQKRVRPPQKPEIKIVIAPVGQPLDLWEKAPDASGWRVPSYKNNRADNYFVRLKFVRNSESNPDSPDYHYRQIEHIMRVYDSSARAVEYLKPNPDFSERNIARADFGTGGPKKIRIEFVNGEEKQGNVTPGSNIFTEDKPEKIAFDEGEKRFVVWDKDGDGKFELRIEVAKDTYTGQETVGEPKQ